VSVPAPDAVTVPEVRVSVLPATTNVGDAVTLATDGLGFTVTVTVFVPEQLEAVPVIVYVDVVVPVKFTEAPVLELIPVDGDQE